MLRANSFFRSKVIRQLSGALVFSIVGRLLQVLLAILLTRELGVVQYGVFVLIYATAQILQQISSLGIPVASMRVIPEYLEENKSSYLRGFLLFSILAILFTTVILATLLLLLSIYFEWSIYKYTNVVQFWAVLFGLTALQLKKRQFSTVDRNAEGVFWEIVFPFLIVNFVIMIVGIQNIFSLLSLLGCSFLSSFAIASLRLRWNLSGIDRAYLIGNWIKHSLPFLLSFGARDLMNRVDVLVLAPIAGVGQVGLYTAAFKIVFLITFPQNILNLSLIHI